MTEGPAKTPVEQAVEHAVDLFVYAPIGLLFDGATLLPQLVEKGRSQVSMARMIGQFAVDQGRTEATKAASRLQDQAAGVLDFIGDSVVVPSAVRRPPPRGRPSRAGCRGCHRDGDRPGRGGHRRRGARPPTSPSPTTTASPPPRSSTGSPACRRRSWPRCSATKPPHRGRKTILSKVAQLQGS